MRIGHNMLAINTYNSLWILEKKSENSLEKLSSGYRINRSADDAAGLSISEKMRAQIRGLNQAYINVQNGISLIQTAEGALNEVHSMLQRMNTLAVQAANDTNNEEDRHNIQEEINQLVNEVDSISVNTEFNGIKLLDGNIAKTAAASSPLVSENESSDVTLENLLKSKTNGLNIIYMDPSYMSETNNFVTTQSGAGGSTISGSTSLKNILQTEIVPQAVISVLKAFSPAFNYLSSSSIGIGLKLYNDAADATLAAVSLGYKLINDNVDDSMRAYQLSVNMASLTYDSNEKLTEASRNALETTIVHEMVHGFMDEALTNGMMGITNGVYNARYTGAQADYQASANAYPSWFEEGMAQTIAGGYANCNDWVNGGMGITVNSSLASIQDAVTNTANALSSGSAKSKYGTGYLACMYLGYLASGSVNEPVTSGDISKGLGKVLSDLIGGKSLDTVIFERTAGKYNNVSDFESKFGDSESIGFIYRLTQAAESVGNGGIATGDFHDSDLLPDEPISTSLFALDTTHNIVKNIYPNGVNVLSGGGKSEGGTAPVSDYSTTIGGEIPTTINPGATIDLSNVSSIKGISYNRDLNILTITESGDYTLTGLNTTGVRVVVSDGVNGNITLKNATINTWTGAGINLEGNANVTLNLIGNNSVVTSKLLDAAIRVTTGATLNIQGSGSLDAESTCIGKFENGAGIGGNSGENGGNIILNGGNITVRSKGGGAGIGGGSYGDGGNITINAGNVDVISADDGRSNYLEGGAGIGGGLSGNGGNITIKGGTVKAICMRNGAGIGGGIYGEGGNITVTGGTVTAGGSDEGAGIGGGGLKGKGGNIIISGGDITANGGSLGAGIGSGHDGEGGTIKISGGKINSTGGNWGAGIGSGAGGFIDDIVITGGNITAKGGGSIYGPGAAGIGGGYATPVENIKVNIDGAGVIIKATGGGRAYAIGGGGSYGGPDIGGTIVKKTGIIFEGNSGCSGRVYGNVTLGGSLDCCGGDFAVYGGSTLTVLNGGTIINHGTFTNYGYVENHGIIGSVSGPGITHHYANGIIKHIKEPTTATIGESLASSISNSSPSTITVAYNGTSRTLMGVWSVEDIADNLITNLPGTIVKDGDEYKYKLTFTSEDGIWFDPLHMSLYQMKGFNNEIPEYQSMSDDYLSVSGPEGGGTTLAYTYDVASAPGPALPPTQPISLIGGIHLQIGANASDIETAIITIESVKASDIGIGDLSVLTHDNALEAIESCHKAIKNVSQIRNNLGAWQNRLEHATSSVSNTSENLQSAESRIKDADIAKCAIEYFKYQILQQSCQSMLIQGNQEAKYVLALLSQ